MLDVTAALNHHNRRPEHTKQTCATSRAFPLTFYQKEVLGEQAACGDSRGNYRRRALAMGGAKHPPLTQAWEASASRSAESPKVVAAKVEHHQNPASPDIGRVSQRLNLSYVRLEPMLLSSGSERHNSRIFHFPIFSILEQNLKRFFSLSIYQA